MEGFLYLTVEVPFHSGLQKPCIHFKHTSEFGLQSWSKPFPSPLQSCGATSGIYNFPFFSLRLLSPPLVSKEAVLLLSIFSLVSLQRYPSSLLAKSPFSSPPKSISPPKRPSFHLTLNSPLAQFHFLNIDSSFYFLLASNVNRRWEPI